MLAETSDTLESDVNNFSVYHLYSMLSVTADSTSYSGNATWYDVSVSTTACGQTYTNDDYIVAVSTKHWGTNSNQDYNPNHDPICNKTINVRDANNSSLWMSMMIVDKCGSCDLGDLDMSEACFQHFRDLSVGKFAVNWEFAT